MTTGRPRPILPEQPAGSNGGKDMGTPAGGGGASAAFRMAGRIRQLFRAVKNALTPKPPAPEPEPRARRKGDEDTGRAFRMTARQIMRRAARIPAEAYAKATAYLADTLDWLNQWHHTADDFTEDVQPAASDHLYPHL